MFFGNTLFLLIYFRKRLKAVLLIKESPYRSCWTLYRSKEWWNTVVSGRMGDVWWKSNFRVTRQTFDIICRELRPYLTRKTTHLRDPLSVEQRVAITLWRLATNVEYRTISALFGIGCSTVGIVVINTCESITKHLFPKYVSLPKGERLKNIVNGFESRWGFPQVAAAIDGSHIPIIKPLNCASDYYNRKGYYSVIVQGLVDDSGQFLNAYIGWPGKCHDARVFHNSTVYVKGCSGDLFPNWTKLINGVEVPLLVLGDAAYPLLQWLMKPYIETPNSSESVKNFNYRHSRARMVVENAFGRLKGRWRILLKRLDCSLDNVSATVSSCITLHNICEKFNDYCSDEWIDNSTTQQSVNNSCHTATSSTSAMLIREAVTMYLSNTN